VSVKSLREVAKLSVRLTTYLLSSTYNFPRKITQT
jgi:hypothetical protein